MRSGSRLCGLTFEQMLGQLLYSLVGLDLDVLVPLALWRGEGGDRRPEDVRESGQHQYARADTDTSVDLLTMLLLRILLQSRETAGLPSARPRSNPSSAAAPS